MFMSSAIRIHEIGGPEVLRWEEVTVGDPGPGEVRLRHGAVGLNFIDVYFRTGVYGAVCSEVRLTLRPGKTSQEIDVDLLGSRPNESNPL